jgi:hypothetical protein
VYLATDAVKLGDLAAQREIAKAIPLRQGADGHLKGAGLADRSVIGMPIGVLGPAQDRID